MEERPAEERAEGGEEEEEGAGGRPAAAMAEEESEEKNGEAGEASSMAELDFLSCLLQPPPKRDAAAASNGVGRVGDPLYYVGLRRLLLQRKAEFYPSTIAHRKVQRQGVRCLPELHSPAEELGEPVEYARAEAMAVFSGRWASSPAPQSILFDTESWSSSRDFRGVNQDLGHRSSFSSTASDLGHLASFDEPAYSFVGMHCIFDSCKASVTILKFGHMSSDLLAYGASDGSLTVCHVSETPSIFLQLRGHSKDVTDFDFSSNNQYIASSSLDKTVRVWEIAKGTCIRVIYGVSSQLCIRFHPVNNNFLSVGNGNREISMINFSTGRVINKPLFENEITAMDNDHTGQLIFAGDSQGCVYSVSVNSHTGSLSRSHRHRSSSKNKSAVTTVQYRTFSLLAHGPVLLVCSRDGNLSFFSVTLEMRGYLTLRCSLKLTPRMHNIHASFCPLLSLEKGEFIVSGSEDSNVYFYDLTRPKHPCVNKLQGHSSPVIGVAWNHGENLLASSDSDGAVIVWKRAKNS
ncbi:hypothetical protein Taro_025073 [Colocasia esculenta]|uniref:WD repeat-containing protein 13 n=1 Tax=Colocasia esculenta TaxID=4460 RepID=A0A843VMA7_COLES|nr:hypothetical protein [Colocasia esculenta]